MVFNFKKIASVFASAVMVSSTVALAAAANFPAPYVQNGQADVAIVYGSTAQATDLVAVTDIASNLQAKLASQTATGGTTSTGTVSGEAVELFTSSKKIYLNDSIDKERTIVTKSHLPVALADGSFQGDVSSTYDQKIDIGSTSGQNNKLVFGRHPGDDNDPTYAVKLGTASGSAVYNLTVTFNKATAFNHSDSEGQELTLFGKKYTVGSETDGTDIVLLKSSQKVTLTNSDPSTEVTIDEKAYTIELTSASDSGATIKVTDSDGSSDSKTIDEGKSKRIKGLEVAVDTADETNFALSATVLVGSNKIKLKDNTAVKVGSDETSVDGTNVRFGDSGSQRPNNITKITFQIATKDTSVDALTQGGEFIDPVFGSLKLFFPSLSITDNSTAREDIKVQSSGSDKATVTFKSWDATEEKTIEWYNNKTTAKRGDGLSTVGFVSLADDGGDNINVFERARINKSEYVVTGNENNGGLWELKTITNDSSTATKSTVEFKNVLTGETKKATITADGDGSIEFAGRTYTLLYRDNRNIENDEFVRLSYPDGSRGTADNMVIYPTIQTSKGAKLFFYEPVLINFADWSGTGTLHGANLSSLKFPDGDGYTSFTATINADASITTGNHSWVFNSKAINLTDAAGGAGTLALASLYFNVGQLTYNLTRGINTNMYINNGKNNTAGVFLMGAGNTTITNPAIVIFEEQDDSSSQLYNTVIVQMEGSGTSSAKVGVSDVEFTWGLDTEFDEIQMKSSGNSKLYKSADYWGTVSTTDQGDTDSYTATISYPDQQVYGMIYAGAVASSATGGTVSGGTVSELGSVTVSDKDVASVTGKNLVVVGGSCVNSVAASLLGSSSPLCGADWEAKTSVGAGSFLIQTFDRGNNKIATLVAGYNAGDTTNAAKALTTQTVDTMVGKKYTGTSSTSVTLATTSTNSTA